MSITSTEFAEALFQQAIADAITARFTGHAKEMRAHTTSAINNEYQATGAKAAVEVRIPGTKTVVGQVSTTISQDAASVTDNDAFAEWVAEHIDVVEYKPVVRTATQAAILKAIEITEDPDTGELVATYTLKDTGEVVTVPGITVRRGGQVKSFTIRNRNDDALLEYVAQHGLTELMAAGDRLMESFATITGEVIKDGDK